MTPSRKNCSFVHGSELLRPKNQGSKGPRQDRPRLLSKDQDQDIKTESRDFLRPRVESRELHDWLLTVGENWLVIFEFDICVHIVICV